MKTLLLIVEIPSTSSLSADEVKWKQILAYIQRDAPTAKDTKRLTQNVWQMPLENGLPFWGRMTLLAQEHEFSMRGLILEESPAWTLYPPSS